MNDPPDHNYIVDRLPYNSNVNPQGLEENLAGKAQRPEYPFIATNTHEFTERIFFFFLKSTERIFEDNIFSGDSGIWLGKKKTGVE